MKRAIAIVFVGLIVPTSQVYAQEVERPTQVTADTPLPDRYPYVVKDILKHCQPHKGFWIDLGAGKGQVAIPLIEATSNPVVMHPERKKHFIEVRSPETFRRWAEDAKLPNFEVVGQGAFSAAEPRAGQGIELRFTKEDVK